MKLDPLLPSREVRKGLAW